MDLLYSTGVFCHALVVLKPWRVYLEGVNKDGDGGVALAEDVDPWFQHVHLQMIGMRYSVIDV